MVRSKGRKANTRNLLSKSFRERGQEKITKNLINYKKGDIVDIKINPSVHKGQPFRFFHGKTGKILSIMRSSALIEVEKTIRNRKIQKKLTIRFEHLSKNKANSFYHESLKLRDNMRNLSRKSNNPAMIFNKSFTFLPGNKIISFNQIEFLNPEPYSIVI